MAQDFTVGDTLYFHFTTRAFATGIPGTLGGTPVLKAYEDNSETGITAGVSVDVDRNSISGLNLATIVATGANGFEAGKQYSVVITTGTVDSVSVVGEVVASFSLSAEAAAVDLANGTDGLGALKTLIDTLDDFVDTEIADIQSRLPAALVNSRIDSTVDATGMETGAVDNILTRQMTESYAANGVAPTLAQVLFAIHQHRMQFGIAGTSLTVRKLDNSTTAFVVTLDDATSPTDAKRV